MFTFDGRSRTAGRSLADVQAHELHQDESSGPLDCELLDLYPAILIVVPIAILLKAFLF